MVSALFSQTQFSWYYRLKKYFNKLNSFTQSINTEVEKGKIITVKNAFIFFAILFALFPDFHPRYFHREKNSRPQSDLEQLLDPLEDSAASPGRVVGVGEKEFGQLALRDPTLNIWSLPLKFKPQNFALQPKTKIGASTVSMSGKKEKKA